MKTGKPIPKVSTVVCACLLAMAAAILLQGCGVTGRPPGLAAPVALTPDKPQTVEGQPLAPGDVIDVHFTFTPQYNTDSLMITPDGFVTLPLIGNVEVQGKTREQLGDMLVGLYSPLLRKPEIIINRRQYVERRIYVGGEVFRPGRLDLQGNLSVLEAIMDVGGFMTRTAEVKNIIVIRQKDGQRYAYSLDLREALEGKDNTPFYLEPRDIVFVPRTTIAKLDQWIDQHINQVIPQAAFTYSAPMAGGVLGIDTATSKYPSYYSR